jgi:hypothetical protein
VVAVRRRPALVSRGRLSNAVQASPVVPAATDGAARRSDDHENGPYDRQDDPDRVEDRNVEQHSEKDEDDAGDEQGGLPGGIDEGASFIP